MNQQNKQRELSAYPGGGSGDLSITHRVEAPSIDEVLKAAKAAISAAKKTIAEQKGGLCGCFGDD